MQVFKKLSITIAIFAIGIFALNMLLGGTDITFITQESYNNISFYKIDVYQYIQNISVVLDDIPNNLNLALPTRQFNDDLVNNLKVIADIFIFIANLLIFPLRVIAVILKFVLGLFGFTMTETTIVNGEIQTNNWWLYNVVNFLATAQLQYV